MTRGPNFQGQKFIKQSFKGRKLHYANFKLCTLQDCDFTDADLKYADFSDANCIYSNFTGASLYCANFSHACLENTIFKPREIFGITMTLTCASFQNMEIDENWLECWLMLAALMKLPDPKKVEKPWLDRLILLLGPDRYVKLKAVFNRRII